jgi:hypothetical protein
MNEYIIFIDEQEAVDLINQINTCMGWPNDDTISWMSSPDNMCEFDLQTGNKLPIGYGIVIKDRILGCLTEEQKGEVFVIPSNINTCVWTPIISGSTT